jgi:hypothetical protein
MIYRIGIRFFRGIAGDIPTISNEMIERCIIDMYLLVFVRQTGI